MKVLYVRKQNGDPWWKEYPKRVRDWFKCHYREGFYRGSLRHACEVNQTSIANFLSMTSNQLKDYHSVILHFMCNYEGEGSKFGSLRDILPNADSQLDTSQVVLLVTNAAAGNLPADEVLDYFDLVFKREPYRDRSRYSLSRENREKIRPTTLSCPVVPANLWNYRSIEASDYGQDELPDHYEHDVFFSGKDSRQDSDFRQQAVEAFLDSDIDFYGGLQPKSQPLPDRVEFPRLSQQEFRRATWLSRINPALPGCGEFTYRHWEIWALSGFMMTIPEINDIELPFSVSEGTHYVTFDGYDDLLDKARYYLNHSDEREQIARAGRELFEREYDFEKHGKFIKKQLREI